MTGNNFREAMDWWKGQNEFVQRAIRNVASARLNERMAGTGEGIGTSDINWEVAALYGDFKDAGEGVSVMVFLVNQLQEVGVCP